MVLALEAMNDEIVLELAELMGRPVRFGGAIGGVKERAFHMGAIASAALADTIIEDSAAFHRSIRREPDGVFTNIHVDQATSAELVSSRVGHVRADGPPLLCRRSSGPECSGDRRGAVALIAPASFAADTGDTAYLAPQILIDVDHSMRVMCDDLDPALCWTGWKDTGRGASLSALGYDSATCVKSFHMKLEA